MGFHRSKLPANRPDSSCHIKRCNVSNFHSLLQILLEFFSITVLIHLVPSCITKTQPLKISFNSKIRTLPFLNTFFPKFLFSLHCSLASDWVWTLSLFLASNNLSFLTPTIKLRVRRRKWTTVCQLIDGPLCTSVVSIIEVCFPSYNWISKSVRPRTPSTDRR